MKAIIVALVIVLGGQVIRGQLLESSSVPQDRLSRLAGRWTIKERYAGDPATYVKQSTCEPFSGGRHLVCHSEAETPFGPSTGLSILSYDASNRTFTQYTIASVGVAALITGTVTDRSWVGATEFLLNGDLVKARVTMTDESPTSWTYKMEGSLRGSPVITIQEARAAKLQ